MSYFQCTVPNYMKVWFKSLEEIIQLQCFESRDLELKF